MISQLSAKYQIGAIHTADTMSIVQTQFGDTLNRCSRRFQVVSWPNLTVLHTQTGYTLKPCTRRFQVVSWPNLTVLHTQTGYKRKPWHRYIKYNNNDTIMLRKSIKILKPTTPRCNMGQQQSRAPLLYITVYLIKHEIRVSKHWNSHLKGHCIKFKYYADGIHSGLTPSG